MAHLEREMRVLLAEDNPTDVDIIIEALHEAEPRVNVTVFGDGRSALDHLRDSVRDRAGRGPNLVLLDLNLPIMSGRELLAIVKTDSSLQTIPVIIVSSSADPTDVEYAYRNSANCYVTKPADLDGFMDAVRRIADLWCGVAELPC